MTDKFIRIADDFYAAPQITPAEVKYAADAGFDLIINNRPDGEEPGQPTAAGIEEAAKAAGIDYVSIPVGRDGITHEHLHRFDEAVAGHEKVLGFCRSGMRSTTLRAFALAHQGVEAQTIIEEARAGGYDLSGHAQTLEALATHSH